MKIYTKKGDAGKTSLFGGNKILKDDLRVEAYGTVDELNAHIGLLISKLPETLIHDELIKSQHILFNIGSHLANDTQKFASPELFEKDVHDLEIQIDNMQATLPELRQFILPGGNEQIAVCHICRTVCRRGERRVVTISQDIELNPIILIYLNRLSDYLFVLSRMITLTMGASEIFWDSKV